MAEPAHDVAPPEVVDADPQPDRVEEPPSPRRPDLLAPPSRGNSGLNVRGTLPPGRKPPGMGAAVLHNTDLAKIANEEWQALLKGERYYCQLVVGTTNEARDVILNVNLSGIRLLDRKTEAVLNQFDIEQILQYSYSQQNSTFSFSYLEEGRFFVTHKFISKDYFEMHQYLGNAIAIVIKLKTQIKKNGPAETLNMIDTQRAERTHSVDTLRRSSRAKLYFEQKYRSRGGNASPTDGSAEDASRSSSDSAAVPASPRSQTDEGGDEGKHAAAPGAHLQSLFAPLNAAGAMAGGASESPAADNGRIKLVEQQYRRFKEYTREHSSDGAGSGADAGDDGKPSSPDTIKGPKEDDAELDTHKSNSSIRSSESSMSLASTKSSESVRQKSKGMSWAGSLRLTKGVNLEGLMGSLRKKPTQRPPTAEEMERQMKRMTMFNNVSVNPEELPEQQVKTDASGRPRLIKTMLEGHYQITAGTLDGLVEALADENAPDTLYIDDFLLTYRVFTTSSVLFEKLLARYNIQPTVTDDAKKDKPKKEKAKAEEKKQDELDSNSVQLIRARVLSVFKKWVDRHWYDFEPDEMRDKLNAFIGQIKASEYSIVSQQLLNFIGQNEKRKQQMQAALAQVQQSLTSGTVVDFVNMDPKAGPMSIAKHLCVVAIKQFKLIQPDEFAIHLWSKKDPRLQQEMTRNLNRFIDRFNKIGYWVATEICAVPNLQKRIAVMERFIQIAKYLFKLQNYNDTIAVLSGLNTIPIYRLKKTWAGVSKEMMAKFRDLEAKVAPENNYKTYRAIEYAAKGDFIPFFGLYMKDLTFMNDGNQTFLPNDIINFEKNRAVMGKIMAIRVSQQSKYEFEGIDKGLLQYCEVIHHHEEEYLTDESYRIEPSNRRRAASISESINSEVDAVSISTVNSEETTASSAVPPEVFD